MIYNERKRTAAVEGELWILRQELTRVQQQKLKSDKQVKMAEEETLRAVDVATRLRAAAEADTAALQQELKVFHAAEHRLKSLNLDHYQDGVLERIAQAVLKGVQRVTWIAPWTRTCSSPWPTMPTWTRAASSDALEIN